MKITYEQIKKYLVGCQERFNAYDHQQARKGETYARNTAKKAGERVQEMA